MFIKLVIMPVHVALLSAGTEILLLFCKMGINLFHTIHFGHFSSNFVKNGHGFSNTGRPKQADTDRVSKTGFLL